MLNTQDAEASRSERSAESGHEEEKISPTASPDTVNGSASGDWRKGS